MQGKIVDLLNKNRFCGSFLYSFPMVIFQLFQSRHFLCQMHQWHKLLTDKIDQYHYRHCMLACNPQVKYITNSHLYITRANNILSIELDSVCKNSICQIIPSSDSDPRYT